MVIVAIPACNEEDHIGACLDALNRQEAAQAEHIVLCVNNTNDATIRAARAVVLRSGTRLQILEAKSPPGQAHAGWARRMAMEEAARLAQPGTVLLTTDADGVADPDWVAANLTALRVGADAVAGWVDLNPADWHRIPIALHEDDARECAYDSLCDEIHALIDPDPADPWPRHTQASGASIAVTMEMYRHAGGMPAIASGEDRAFLRRLREMDARIRHAPECHVVVSGRTVGRAPGGMAETIRRRLVTPDLFLDDRLEPAEDCARRASLRQRLRACRHDKALIAAFAGDAGLHAADVASALRAETFGLAWTKIERASPALIRQRVPVSDLPRQMARAAAICRAWRGNVPLPLDDAEELMAAD